MPLSSTGNFCFSNTGLLRNQVRPALHHRIGVGGGSAIRIGIGGGGSTMRIVQRGEGSGIRIGVEEEEVVL